MKRFRKFLLWLLIIAALCYTVTSLTGKNFIYKALLYNFAGIDDYKIFDNNIIGTGTPQPIPVSVNYNKIQLTDSLKEHLTGIETTAFLVIQNDSILYEEYWDGYSDSSLSGSFSMAKSFVSTMIGIAIQEGKIKSLDEQVGNFLPEFKTGEKQNLTIRDLMTMSSGTNWDESYSSPFSVTTELYYGKDIFNTATSVKIVKTPGTEWRYKSGDTQLLGLILEKATGKSLSEYASEKLWQPMGAVHPALWSIDKKGGDEKAYCCINSNARDFARLGLLYLHKGNWHGNQILDTSFVNLFTAPLSIKDEDGKTVDYYGYQWWILPDRKGVFYARGILGQYIIVIPQRNTVIVRLGKSRGTEVNNSYSEVYQMTDWALKNLRDKNK